MNPWSELLPLQRRLDAFEARQRIVEQAPQLPAMPLTLAALEAWLRAQFPRYFGRDIPWAPYHQEFWAWVMALRPGVRPSPFVAVWPRKGGKSTNAEIATATINYHGLRPYILYVSGTQSQADDHVTNVATMLDILGVPRQLATVGLPQAWRHNRLQTARGTIDALGLKGAGRGIKIDEHRVGMLVVDDVDDHDDSADVIAGKIRNLTQKILPACTDDHAVLAVQNLPNDTGVFAQLVSGQADFLHDRIVSGPHPALTDFDSSTDLEAIPEAGGRVQYRILKGTPTWAGLDVAACENLIRTMGLRAFLIEDQHEISRLSARPFPREKWQYFTTWPQLSWFDELVQSWDATFGTEADTKSSSFVAGHLWGRKGRELYLMARAFDRWAFPETCQQVLQMCAAYPGDYYKLIEMAANGMAIYQTLRQRVPKILPQPVGGRHGSKLARAQAIAVHLHEGRAWLPSPALAPWVVHLVDYLHDFPAKPNDDGDALSQAWARLMRHEALAVDPASQAQQAAQRLARQQQAARFAQRSRRAPVGV